jgi:hypothetical protein
MEPKLTFPDQYTPPMITVLAGEFLQKCTNLPKNMRFLVNFTRTTFGSWVVKDRVLKLRNYTGVVGKSKRYPWQREMLSEFETISDSYISVESDDFQGMKIYGIGGTFWEAIITLESGNSVDFQNIKTIQALPKRKPGRPKINREPKPPKGPVGRPRLNLPPKPPKGPIGRPRKNFEPKPEKQPIGRPRGIPKQPYSIGLPVELVKKLREESTGELITQHLWTLFN